ncbi:hypothetical protein CBL_03943 [Carabus blaptoides fortunei]
MSSLYADVLYVPLVVRRSAVAVLEPMDEPSWRRHANNCADRLEHSIPTHVNAEQDNARSEMPETTDILETCIYEGNPGCHIKCTETQSGERGVFDGEFVPPNRSLVGTKGGSLILKGRVNHQRRQRLNMGDVGGKRRGQDTTRMCQEIVEARQVPTDVTVELRRSRRCDYRVHFACSTRFIPMIKLDTRHHFVSVHRIVTPAKASSSCTCTHV